MTYLLYVRRIAKEIGFVVDDDDSVAVVVDDAAAMMVVVVEAVVLRIVPIVDASSNW